MNYPKRREEVLQQYSKEVLEQRYQELGSLKKVGKEIGFDYRILKLLFQELGIKVYSGVERMHLKNKENGIWNLGKTLDDPRVRQSRDTRKKTVSNMSEDRLKEWREKQMETRRIKIENGEIDTSKQIEAMRKAWTGRKHKESSRLAQSLAHRGDKNPAKRPEVRDKIRESVRKRYYEGAYKKFYNSKETSIEKKTREFLESTSIKFTPQYWIKVKKFGSDEEYVLIADFFVEPNLCIFCDGEYWHNRTPKIRSIDALKTNTLIANGYRVLRLGGIEIKEDFESVKTKLLEFLK